MEQKSLFFFVDYNATDNSNILDIHRSLLKET